MRISRKIIASIAVVVVVGAVATIGVGAYAVKTVLAQTAPTQTPNAQSPSSTASQYENLFLQNLAQQLGTTVDKLKAAITSAAGSVIDQAQKDGKITQSQADQLKQKVANGNFPGPFFGGKGFHGGFGFEGHMGKGMFGASVQDFATALGMTPQDLMTELQSGKSIADVATEKKVDLQQVTSKVLAAVKSRLDTAVTNQKMTQAQADQIYQNLSSNINTIVQQKGFMGRGGMHNGWKKFNQNPQQQPTTSPSSGL